MNNRLQHLFNTIENDRREASSMILQLSDDAFNFAPAGKWSVHQILAHLVAGDKMTIQYMGKKFLGVAKVGESGIREELLIVLLKISQRLPFKFKAPRIVVENTNVFTNARQLIAEWEQVRLQLKAFLDNIEPAQLNKLIYKHPRAGMLNVQHGLIFTHEHFIHHAPQLRRLVTQNNRQQF